MKRLRHYDKDTAIVLSCFGSVVQQDRYHALLEQICTTFPDYPVELAVTSRMVIKRLAAKEQHYLNLPQTLANLDMAGYRHIIVVSCYLFPTDEHAMVTSTVRGFGEFSLSHFRVTPALLNQTGAATQLLRALHARFPLDEGQANLYISHGSPRLDNPGYSAMQYTSNYLSRMNPGNFCCSLEGAFPFSDMRDSLVRDILSSMPVGSTRPRLRLIPLLLVSGNHFINDLAEISEQLGEYFDIELAEPVTGDRFCLLDMPELQSLLLDQISLELKKRP